MAYSVDWVKGGKEEVGEIADFLASFDSGNKSNEEEQVSEDSRGWRKRMSSWWDENPYLHEETPKGLILRSSDDVICGFLGLISHDYILQGERIPSLALTTHFVESQHRTAAFPLFLRALRLSNQYQLVDGTPNEEATVFLQRSGFTQIEPHSVLVYPIRPTLFKARSGKRLSAAGRGSDPSPCCWAHGFVQGIDQIKGVDLDSPSDLLRKHLDVETLNWYLNSGTEKKVFAGWADERGLLQCFVIGIRTKIFGVNSVLILEASANSKLGEGALPSFVSFLTLSAPGPLWEDGIRVAFLPLQQKKIPWFRYPVFRFNRQFPIFHKLSEQSIAHGHERISQLSEGDRIFI